MRFTTPTPLFDAMREITRRRAVPTALDARALAELGEQFWQDSFASAQTMLLEPLEELQRSIAQIVSPEGGDRAAARLRVKQVYESLGYSAQPGEERSIKDLSSDARINLVIDHWTKAARGKATTVRNNDDSLLWSHPCYELVRIGDREKKRNWHEIWRGAGGRISFGQGIDGKEGRLIAKKDDPIWFAISEFNRAEEPFRYNSGAGRVARPRKLCVELGVIQPTERTGPTPLMSPFADKEELN
jgi:hypothetical protein